jgi:hypothetical protein
VRTRDALEAALDAAGWKLIDGPKPIAGGWKAMIRRGATATSLTASTELCVLEDLLRSAQERTRQQP